MGASDRGRSLRTGAGALALAALMVSTALPAAAQDSAADEYAALLQQISDQRSNILQREYYVSQQEARIAQLRDGIAAAQSIDGRAELLPILRNMVEGLDEVMSADLPFLLERRFALLDDLRNDIRADDASLSDGFRRALDLYGEEVELGLTVGSYTGNNPVEPGGRLAACLADPMSARCDLSEDQRNQLESIEGRQGIEPADVINDFNASNQLPDGNYIHYGRLAFFYLERDSSVGYRYNEDTKAWDKVDNSALLGLRQNVRVARGESAITTMTAPIRVAGGAPDAS